MRDYFCVEHLILEMKRMRNLTNHPTASFGLHGVAGPSPPQSFASLVCRMFFSEFLYTQFGWILAGFGDDKGHR